MADQPQHHWDESPTIEVRIFRHGELIHHELCESVEQATWITEEWSELDGVECEIDDLSTSHRQGDILEPGPTFTTDEDYPPTT